MLTVNHAGTQTLTSPRLTLRPFRPEDAQPMFHNWASDPQVTEYLTWQPHQSIQETEQVLERWIKSYSRLDFYQWAIELNQIGQPVGSIAVVDRNDTLAMVHIGYCIGKNWWRQGITSEAFRTIIPFFFDVVNVNRIESRHDTRNPHSGMVMKKAGLIYEGTARQGDWCNKGICDAAWYAMLRSDYLAAKNA